MADEGADIIDVGGESSRPGSDPIPSEDELRRVTPVIKALRKQTKALLSVDTTKSEVVAAALDEGADIINDISALRFDPDMAPLAARRKVPVILMHMKGTPKNMQLNPHYEDVTGEIRSFFVERIETAQASGIRRDKIIIDPGIGFGKRFEDNLVLIKNLGAFRSLDRPILVGVSRKAFLGRLLNKPPSQRLEGTVAASVISILGGAHILRVHDVASVRMASAVADAIINEEERAAPRVKSPVERGGYVS